MNCKSFKPKHGQYAEQEVQSELFANLLDHYQGDIVAANQAYNMAFSEQFMDYLGGNWTTEVVEGTTIYTEPTMQTVLDYIRSQADELLPELSEDTNDALRHTNMAALIIPEMGVTKQQTVIDFMASLVTKHIVESSADQKKFTESELFDTIQEYFRSKYKEYKENNPDQAAEVRKILRNFDQLKYLAKQKIMALNQVTIEESETELDDTASMEKRNYEDSATFKIDGKVTMSTRLRRFFSFIPDALINKDGMIEDKTGYTADMVEIIPFDTVYNTLISLLSGQRADYDAMMNHLKKNIKAHPWIQNVIEKLDSADDMVKTEFVVAMSKHYVSMKFIMWSQGQDGQYDLRVFDANANAIARQIQDEWYNNFLNQSITIASPTDSADLIVDPQIGDKLIKQFESWVDVQKGFKVTSKESLDKIKAESREWFATLGIKFSDKAWKEISNGKKKFTGLFTYKGGPGRLLYENLKSRLPLNISVSTNNPFAGGAFNKLALVEAKYSRLVLSNSHRAGNETVYSHALNKYNIKRLRDLKTDPSTVENLLSVGFSANSMWLEKLQEEHAALAKYKEDRKKDPELEKPETPFLDSFNLHYMSLEAIKEMGGFDGPEMKQTDTAEHEVVKISLFQNKGNDKVYFMYPTMSDKTTMMIVEAPKTKVEVDENGIITEDTVNLVYEQLVLPEINRIHYHQNRVEEINDSGMSQGWNMFYMIPELNNLDVLFDEAGKLKSDILAKKEIVAEIKQIVKNHVTALVQEKVAEWEELGIGKTDTSNKSNMVVQSFMDRTYMSSSNKYFSPIIKGAKNKLNFAATDFVTNYLLANANIFQTIVGDPAMFFKSGIIKNKKKELTANNEIFDSKESNQYFVRNRLNNEERIKIVEDTFLNIGKRLAGDMAPGYDLNDQENNNFRVLFVKDAEVGSIAQSFFDSLNLLAANNYKKIESTDAQEMTTMLEHLYILRHTGKMSPDLYNKVSGIIKERIAAGDHYYIEAVENALDKKELKTFHNLVFQPLKPVYVNNIIDVDNNIDRRVYIKSSSFALSPSLTVGSELDKIRILMEKKGIDRLAFLTAVKVGSPKVSNMPVLVNEDRSINEELLNQLENDSEKLSLTTQVLSRDGFRIQQEIPYDADKKEINVGTQERKLLFNNILHVNGMQDLFHEYNNHYQELFKIASLDLRHELGYSYSDGIDIHKLRSLLIDEAMKRNYPINDIYALDIDEETNNFVLPLWASNSADRIQALLNSIVDNRVRKMSFPGKSLVLATQEGFKFKEWKTTDQHSGVTFVEGFNQEEGLKPMRVENGEFKPGQILVPFKFLDNKGKALKIDNFITEKDGKKYLNLSKQSEVSLPSIETIENILTQPKFSRGSGGFIADRIKESSPSKISYETVNTETGKVVPSGSGLYISTEEAEQLQVVFPELDNIKHFIFREVNLSKGRPVNADAIVVLENGENKNVKLDFQTEGSKTNFDPELLKVFGFRIPTQGHNSMAYFEIVGFLPKSAGDMIVAPRELVIQMGSDFDVDKVYLYMHHTDFSTYDDNTERELKILEAKERYLIDNNKEVFTYKEGDTTFTHINYINEIIDSIHNSPFTAETVKATKHLPEYGIKAGDRLFSSFRATITDVVGNRKFYNPDRVDFVKLKNYARNMMEEQLPKLERINKSSLDNNSDAELLDSWITDPEELKYAKALKQILIIFNKQRRSQEAVLFNAKEKLFEEAKESIEISKERKALKEEISKLKAKKSFSIRKVERKTDSVNNLFDLAKRFGLSPKEFFDVKFPAGREGVATLEKLLNPGETVSRGLNETRDLLMGMFSEIEKAIKENGNKEEDFIELSLLRSKILKELRSYKQDIQNKIIDIHFNVMSNTHDDVQRQIHEPLAYGNLKGGQDLAAKIDTARKNRLEAKKVFSPLSDSYQKKKFINAMAGRVGGVGVFSLDSVLNSVMQHGEFTSGKPIELYDDSGTNGQPITIRFGNKVTKDGNLSNKYVLGSKRFKSDVIAAYQSAAVDNEKEQVMDKINVNNYTYDVIRILNQSGFEEDIVAPFISQDIIFEYVDKLSKGSNSLKDFDPLVKDKIVAALITKYLEKTNDGKLINDYKENGEQGDTVVELRKEVDKLGASDLMQLIELGENDPRYYRAQVGLLLKFLELQVYGAELKKIQSAINTDSAGIGKSLFASLAKAESVYNLDKTLIRNGESTIGEYTRNQFFVSIDYRTINGFATREALLLNNALWVDLFPFRTDQVAAIMDEVMEIIGKKGMNYAARAEFYERVWKEVKSYLFSDSQRLGLSTEEAQEERHRLLFDVITNETVEHYSLARIIDSIQDHEYVKNNPLLTRLKARIGKGTLPSTISFNAATAENYDELNLYTSFMDMLVNPVVLGEFNGKTYTTQDLGRELILYSYLTGGIQEATQFIKYIPVEYLHKIGFSEKLKGTNFNDQSLLGVTLLKQTPYEYSTFTQQFIQHNPANALRGDLKDFVAFEEGKVLALVDPENPNGRSLKGITTLEIINDENNSINNYMVERGLDNKKWLTEFISFRDDTVPQKYHLFKYMGGNTYERIDVLGTKAVGKKHVGSIKEYAYSHLDPKSSVNNDTLLKDVTKQKTKKAVIPEVRPANVVKKLATKPIQKVNEFIDGMDLASGDTAIINDALDNIAALTTNLGYKEYAEEIQAYIEKEKPSWNVVVVDNPEEYYIGRTVGKTIYINSAKIISRSHLEEVVLHELTHVLTSDLVNKYQTEPDSLAAPQKKVIARLNSLFETYRNAILEEFNLPANSDVKAFIKLNGESLTREQKAQLYGAHNLKEFFALSMTSEEFQTKLNDKGLFEKFLKVIHDILKVLGIQFSDEVADTVVSDIVTLIQNRTEELSPPVVTNTTSTTPARFSSKEAPLKIFVDGSDIKDAGKIGYGVHLEHEGQSYNISGHYNKYEKGIEKLGKELGIKVEGSPSNGVMELYGSLVAIQNTPRGEYVEIFQDLEGVQLWILSRLIMRLTDNMHLSESSYKKDFWGKLSEAEQKKIHDKVREYIDLDETLLKKKIFANEKYAKGNFAKDETIRVIADKIVDEILQRPGRISYFWVKGHSGVKGNEAVDAVAKDTQEYNKFPELFNTTFEEKPVIKEENPLEKTTNNPVEYTLNSGGAYGADTEWDLVAREFGVSDIKHYKGASRPNLSQRLKNAGVKATIATQQEMDEGYQALNLLMKKEMPRNDNNDLLARDYLQVKNSDAVFAITTIKNANTVEGGTNYAVQFAIKQKKPIYVLNLVDKPDLTKKEGNLYESMQWYKYNYQNKRFELTSPPVLTKRFAGVGSRDIENYSVLNKQTGKWEPRAEYLGDKVRDAVRQEIRNTFNRTFAGFGRSVESIDESIDFSNTIEKLMKEGIISKKCN